jgi:hypothetical protein
VPLGALAGAVPFFQYSRNILQIAAPLSGAAAAWLVWWISSGRLDRSKTGQVQA